MLVLPRLLFRLMFFVLPLVGLIVDLHAAERTLALEVEIANERGGTAQLFYDIGQPSSQHDSVRLPLPASSELQRVRFPLPAEPIKLLRLDPSDEPCVVRIGHIRLLTGQGEVLKEFGPEHLRPMWQIQDISVEDGIATVRSLATANDPMLLIDEPVQAEVHRWLGRATVRAPAVLLLGGIVAVLLFVAVAGAVRAAIGREPSSPALFPRARLLVFGGVFLVVAGARLAWLKDYSSPLPFWDEWEADALYLLIPLQGQFLDWNALFIPQAEHRIVVTRLITLVGTIVNGEWDPRIGMVASATMFAAAIGLVATLAMRAGAVIGGFVALALAALAALPFDVSNVFWGGQSQMYALVLLAVCTLALASAPDIHRFICIAAAAAAIVSLGTMGTGFVAPGIAAAICAVRWLREKTQKRRLAGLAAIFAVISVAGLLFSANSRRHAPNYADSLAEFWSAFEGFAAWPMPSGSIGLLVQWSPWLVQCFLVARRREHTALDWFAVGVGAWALINAAGLSFGRPDLAPPTDPRHFTALFANALALLTNAAALTATAVSTHRAWFSLAPAAAALVGIIAMAQIDVRGFHSAQAQAFWRDARDQVVLPFLWSGDRELLRDLPFDGRCPYWNSAVLAHYLESPLLQPLLPFKLRKALALRPEAPLTAPEPGTVTLAARTLMKSGLSLAALGAVLLGAGCYSLGRSPSRNPTADQLTRADP